MNAQGRAGRTTEKKEKAETVRGRWIVRSEGSTQFRRVTTSKAVVSGVTVPGRRGEGGSVWLLVAGVCTSPERWVVAGMAGAACTCGDARATLTVTTLRLMVVGRRSRGGCN